MNSMKDPLHLDPLSGTKLASASAHHHHHHHHPQAVTLVSMASSLGQRSVECKQRLEVHTISDTSSPEAAGKSRAPISPSLGGD